MTIETQTPQPQRRWGRLLLAAALRDAQRVGGVAGYVVGAEVGVGGGVAGLEGGEL